MALSAPENAGSMATAAKSPEPWEETGDCQVPFDDLFNQLSESRSSKHLPSLLSRPAPPETTKSQFCLEEWKRISTVGRELDPSAVSALLGASPDPFVRPERSKGWPASWEHSGSAFGRFGYLPHCDLVPWDVERAKAPERSWPADGAVSRLYDGKRKDKAAWKPTTWKHHGPSFPAVPSLATSLSTPALRSLQRKASKTAKERVRGRSDSRSDSRASEDIERARSVTCITAATAAMSTRQSFSSPSRASKASPSLAEESRSSKSGHAAFDARSTRRHSEAIDAQSTRRHSEPWKIVGEILLD